MLLDCGKAEIRQVPFGPAEAGFVALVIDTKVAHALVSGEYAVRRAECEEAARQLGISLLGSLTTLPPLADPVLRRRARHVLTDCARARAIADALDSERAADTIGVYRFIGELLTEGHASLRDDFEVSWSEADVTVETTLAAGALGAKMIGGGFGGSVLALVPKDRLLAVRAAVSAEFERRSWVGPEFLNAIPSQSARKLLFRCFPGRLRPPSTPHTLHQFPPYRRAAPGGALVPRVPSAARPTRARCSLAPARCAARAPPAVAASSRRRPGARQAHLPTGNCDVCGDYRLSPKVSHLLGGNPRPPRWGLAALRGRHRPWQTILAARCQRTREPASIRC